MPESPRSYISRFSGRVFTIVYETGWTSACGDVERTLAMVVEPDTCRAKDCAKLETAVSSVAVVCGRMLF